MKQSKLIRFFAKCMTAVMLMAGVTQIAGGVIGLSSGNQTVLADEKGVGDNETAGNDGQGDEYSFYHLASSAATYFDGSQNGNTKAKFMDADAIPGNAGGLIGYEDPQYDTHHFMGTLTSFLSNSGQGHSYQAYQPDKGQSMSSNKLSNVYYYTLYGHALESMGLDSTDTSQSIGSILREGAGMIMMVLYTTAISVPMIFRGVGQILQLFNPFQFFIGAVQTYSGDRYERDVEQAQNRGWKNYTSQNQRAFGAFANGIGHVGAFYGKLYNIFQNFGLFIVLPFTLIFGLAMWVLFNIKVGSMLKKWFIRLLVIVIGVPIFADLYTNTLNEFVRTSSTNPTANIVLASTFDDFEGWARTSRLAMPRGDKITITFANHASGDVADSTNDRENDTTNVRNLAMHINWVAHNGLVASNAGEDGYDDSTFWNNGKLWSDGSDDSNATSLTKSMGAGFSLLGRFIQGARYTAADYETMYKAHHTDSQRKTILKGIKYLATNTNAFFEDGKHYFADTSANPKESGTNVVFLHNASPEGLIVSNSGKEVTFTGNGNSQSSTAGPYGLSSLGLYNYLTSDFSDTNVTCYSMSKAASMLVARSHHSVNAVGTSVTRIGYFINALALFFVITEIGWGYAIATLASTLTREFKILYHALPAMGGILTAASKLLGSIVVIIVQLLLTEFLYTLSMDLLMAMNMGAASIFTKNGLSGQTPVVQNNPGPTADDAVGSVITIGNQAAVYIHHLVSPILSQAVVTIKASELGTFIWLLASTLLTILFGTIALRIRGTAVKAIDEAIGGFIDKLFLTGNSNPLADVGTPSNGAASELSSDDNESHNAGANFMNRALSTGVAASYISNNAKNHAVNNNNGKGHGDKKKDPSLKTAKNQNKGDRKDVGKVSNADKQKPFADDTAQKGTPSANEKHLHNTTDGNHEQKHQNLNKSDINNSTENNPNAQNSENSKINQLGESVDNSDPRNQTLDTASNDPSAQNADNNYAANLAGDNDNPTEDSSVGDYPTNEANQLTGTDASDTVDPSEINGYDSENQDSPQTYSGDLATDGETPQVGSMPDSDVGIDGKTIVGPDGQPLTGQSEDAVENTKPIVDAQGNPITASDGQEQIGNQSDPSTKPVATQQGQVDAQGNPVTNPVTSQQDQVDAQGNPMTKPVATQQGQAGGQDQSENRGQVAGQNAPGLQEAPANRRKAANSAMHKLSAVPGQVSRKLAGQMAQHGLNSSNATVQASAAKLQAYSQGKSSPDTAVAALPTETNRGVAANRTMSGSEVRQVAAQRYAVAQQGTVSAISGVKNVASAARSAAKASVPAAMRSAGAFSKGLAASVINTGYVAATGHKNAAITQAAQTSYAAFKHPIASAPENNQRLQKMANNYNNAKASMHNAKADFKNAAVQTWQGRNHYTDSVKRENARAMKHYGKAENKIRLGQGHYSEAGENYRERQTARRGGL